MLKSCFTCVLQLDFPINVVSFMMGLALSGIKTIPFNDIHDSKADSIKNVTDIVRKSLLYVSD